MKIFIKTGSMKKRVQICQHITWFNSKLGTLIDVCNELDIPLTITISIRPDNYKE